MKLLYVEDDPFDADLTRRALSKVAPGAILDIARTQSEALQFLRGDHDYDLMLTDLRLPDGSGFELLAYVRENRLPMAVVVITGQGDEEIAVSVLKAGADDYLIKGQDYLEHLSLTLESALERYRAEVARLERPLRVLFLESNPPDIENTRRHFANHAHHIHLEFVGTIAEVERLMSQASTPLEYDAILLDYSLHDLDALSLLKDLRQVRGLDLPIILVTGHGNEEIAAQALRLGASDYVVKSPDYLFRLPGLLENAYHRAQLQREQDALRASEERFRRLAENAPDIIYRFRVRPILSLDYVSPAVEAVIGYSVDELLVDNRQVFKLVHPNDRKVWLDVLKGKAPGRTPVTIRFQHRDGALLWLEGRNVPIYDSNGDLIAHEGIIRDVTERKQAEEHIQRQLQRLNALRTVDTAITVSLDLQVTLNVLLEHVIMQLGVDAAAVLLFDQNTQTLSYSAGIGFRSRAMEDVHLRLGEGNAGQAAFQRRTIHMPDRAALLSPDGFSDWLTEENFIAYYGTPLIAKGQVKGVLEVYHRSALDPDPEWLSFYETLAGQAAIAIDNAELFENLQRANLELTLAYDTTLEGWVRALDLRDKEIKGHTQRVTEMTLRLARAMGVNEVSLHHIQRGALLHDIGKMAIPDDILHKPGPLSEEEWDIMQKHPVYSYELISRIGYLRPALDIPYSHHERWDGSGYPRGLKGEQIPLAARIFAVVDVWDALSSDRPYREGWDQSKVLEHIRLQSGSHFDPQVVDKFLELFIG